MRIDFGVIVLDGASFLALWNDCDPARTDYHIWHSREHVPERLSVPGMVSARRYGRLGGSLPTYFTLYELDSLDVLNSSTYTSLVASPTRWSSSMRASMYNFFRRGCSVVFSSGAGSGGVVAIALLQVDRGAVTPDYGPAIAALPGLCAAHMGEIDRDVQDLAIAADAEFSPNANAILIVEGFDETALTASLRAIEQIVRPVCRAAIDWSTYTLLFAMKAADVGDMVWSSSAHDRDPSRIQRWDEDAAEAAMPEIRTLRTTGAGLSPLTRESRL